MIVKGYKYTEIGVIPEDWVVKGIGEILYFGSGKDYKHLSLGDYPVYGTGGVMTYVNGFIYEGESVGIGRKGTIDKPVLLEGKFWTVDTLFFTHSFKNVLPKFVYYKFLQIKWKDYNEASGVPSLNKNTLNKIKIAVPDLIEQTAIANALSDMDALIAQTSTLIEKKKAIKQGVMQELLKPKKGWVTKKLGEVYFTLKGKNLGKSNLNHNGKYECILYGELFTTYDESITEIKNRTNDLGVSSIYDDILFPGSTTTSGIDLAKCSVVLKNDIQLGGDIVVLRKQAIDVDSQFVAFYLNQFCKNEIAQSTRGITIHHLYGKDLIGIKIQLPTLVQQKSIATAIVDIRQEIKLIESKLQKLKLQKQGMMQALLTGKIRLG